MLAPCFPLISVFHLQTIGSQNPGCNVAVIQWIFVMINVETTLRSLPLWTYSANLSRTSPHFSLGRLLQYFHLVLKDCYFFFNCVSGCEGCWRTHTLSHLLFPCRQIFQAYMVSVTLLIYINREKWASLLQFEHCKACKVEWVRDVRTGSPLFTNPLIVWSRWFWFKIVSALKA